MNKTKPSDSPPPTLEEMIEQGQHGPESMEQVAKFGLPGAQEGEVAALVEAGDRRGISHA